MYTRLYAKNPDQKPIDKERMWGDWLMIGYIALGLALGLPLALGLIFRVGTSNLFFSLMAGELLSRYFGSNTEQLIKQTDYSGYLGSYGQATIVVLPMILTAIILRGSLNKRKTAMNIIPLALTGVVLAAFTLPLLPEAIQSQIRSIEAGAYLLDLHSVIIGTVIALQLVALWILNRSKGKENS